MDRQPPPASSDSDVCIHVHGHGKEVVLGNVLSQPQPKLSLAPLREGREGGRRREGRREGGRKRGRDGREIYTPELRVLAGIVCPWQPLIAHRNYTMFSPHKNVNELEALLHYGPLIGHTSRNVRLRCDMRLRGLMTVLQWQLQTVSACGLNCSCTKHHSL